MTDQTDDYCQPSGMQPRLEISIDAKGDICVETLGTVGKQCDLLAGRLEASLGTTTSRINKETYDE